MNDKPYCPTYQDAFNVADDETKTILIFYYDYYYKNIIINPEIDYIIYFLQYFNPTCIIDIYRIKRSLEDFIKLKEFIHDESIIISNVHLIKYFFGEKYTINKCRKILCNELKKYKNCEKVCQHYSPRPSPSLVTIGEYDDEEYNYFEVIKTIKRKHNSFNNLIEFYWRAV